MDTFDLDAFRNSLYDSAVKAGRECSGGRVTADAVNEMLIAIRDAAGLKSLTSRDVQKAVEGFYQASRGEVPVPAPVVVEAKPKLGLLSKRKR